MEKLISYAIDFVSFLIENTNNKDHSNIKSIILFGSVARGENDKDSDVDIFIDSADKSIEKKSLDILDKFYESIKFKNYWKLIGIDNHIHLIVGKLENWKLKNSMMGDSIVLYEKYLPKLDDGKNMTILSWGIIKNNSKRVMINKSIFGYKHYQRTYEGILRKYQGSKLGSNAILIPSEHLTMFLKSFHKHKVPVKIRKVFEYET